MIKIICIQTILSLLMIGCNHLEDRDASFTVLFVQHERILRGVSP